MGYRGDFLVGHEDKITGKTVLELAAGHGPVSVEIDLLNPGWFYLTDGNLSFFQTNPVKEKYNGFLLDIIHEMPEFYSLHPNVVDTVICCGFLYHTAHPIWAIEQILLGRPKHLYLESHFETGKVWYGIEHVDEHGQAIGYPGQAAIALTIPAAPVILACETLGYKLVDTITRPHSDVNIYDTYYEFWTKTTGLWFERIDD